MPTPSDDVKTTLRLPRALHNQLRHAAIDANKDMNDLIVEAIERYLKGGRR